MYVEGHGLNEKDCRLLDVPEEEWGRVAVSSGYAEL